MNRHPLSVWSLIVGLLFAATAVAGVARDHGVVTGDQLLIAIPLALIGLGVAGLTLSLARPSTPSPQPVDPTADSQADLAETAEEV